LSSNSSNFNPDPPHLQNHSLQEELTHQHHTILAKQETFHQQRYKKTWVIKGDRNTSFFHQSILKRTRRNRITHLQNPDGSISTTPEQLANTVNAYFRHIFTAQNNLDSDQWNQQQEHIPMDHITVIATDDFTHSTPSLQELQAIIKNMRSSASPGPDGLNAAFYKATSNWTGQDILQLVSTFYCTATLPGNINDTHIALIPKISAPSTPKVSGATIRDTLIVVLRPLSKTQTHVKGNWAHEGPRPPSKSGRKERTQ